MSLEEKKRLRTQFMKWLYNETDGDEQRFVDPAGFAARFGVDTERVRTTVQYLEGELLVEPEWTLGPTLPEVAITHYGVREIEEALSEPDRPTEHFVPMVNVTTIHGNVVGSQLQQGSPGATQSGVFTPDERQRAREVVAQVKRALPELELPEEQERQLAEDIEILERELAKPEPRGFTRELLSSMRAVVEGAAGGAAAGALLGLPWPGG